MGKFEEIDELVASGNGYLKTTQVVDNGISKHTLASYVSERGMEKVAHGIYLSQDGWQDPYYELMLNNGRIIFSHESALYLHGLMEREPRKINVTVPAGYNATHLRKKGVRVYQEKADVCSMGKDTVKTQYGNAVQAFDMDRTICDLIRRKQTVDVQVFQYAMKEYMKGKDKNIHNLRKYAKALGILDQVRTYTEVML